MASKNKVCVILRKAHIHNPIQASIKLYCDKERITIFDISEAEKTKDFDLCIIFNNNITTTYAKRNVWWLCDLRPHYQWQRVKFDAIFLCNKLHIDDYSRHFNCPVYYLPQCGDDRKTQATGRIFNSDCIFIGNFLSIYHKGRMQEILDIKKAGVDISILSGESRTVDMKYIYANMPYCLAISPNAKGYTSNRLYNILASKGFCITKYFDGIEELFENRKHLVWYHKPEEVKEIVDYYYDNPEEYEKIKEEGYKLYQQKHTAKNRIDEIINTLQDLS